MKHNRKRWLLAAAAFVLLAVLGFSLWKILSARRDYAAEQQAHTAQLSYRPELPEALTQPLPAAAPTSVSEHSETAAVPADEAGAIPGAAPDSVPASAASPTASEGCPAEGDGISRISAPSDPDGRPFVNKTIQKLRADYPDAVGWIRVPGTDVDYPFVQANDNSYYLRRGIDGKYLYAGVPFLDCRCPADFSGENSIVYGHNLRNGSMFGTLERFKQQEFLEAHPYFYVFLEDRIFRVEIVACLMVDPSEAPALFSPVCGGDFFSVLRRNARCLAPGAEEVPGARYVTLSTCDYELDDGRVLLVGRIVQILQ